MKFSMRLIRKTTTLITMITALSANADLSMNDVTFLLPIPKSIADLRTNYLSASTLVTSGPLVSSSNLALFDWSTIGSEIDLRQRANIDRLAVLGVRLDPCFKDQFREACRPQIRLVMQTILFNGATATTSDVGIHLFFDTTEAQIIDLIRFAADYRVKFLGPNSAKAPLQIQPIVMQEGTQGAFWQAMKARLQLAISSSRRSRIAFFTVHPDGRSWTFQSFDLNGRESRVIEIPGIRDTRQRIDNHIQGSTIEFEASGGLLPRSAPGSDQTFDYLNDSIQFRRSGESRLRPLATTLDRLENPTMHLPGTIDCLSCHSTPSIKTNFRNVAGGLLGRNPGTFVSTTLPASSMLNLFERDFEARDFRLLGYRDDKPTVGQRVINESAAIVDSLAGRGIK